MLDLLDGIKALEKRRIEINQKYQVEMQGIEEALRLLREMNEVCEECDGQGWHLRPRACAEDDRPDPSDPNDRITCTHCHGTGRKFQRGQRREVALDDFNFR